MRRFFYCCSIAFLAAFPALSDEKAVAEEKFYIVPKSKISPGVAAQVKAAARESFSGEQQKQYAIGPVNVDGTVRVVSLVSQSGAHDTFQLNCYRCALGQAGERIDKKFCESQYEIWDATKEVAKRRCK